MNNENNPNEFARSLQISSPTQTPTRLNLDCKDYFRAN